MNMLSTFYLIFFIMYLHVLSFFPILQDFAITVVFFNSTITLQENWTKVVSRGLQKHALHLNNLTIAQQHTKSSLLPLRYISIFLFLKCMVSVTYFLPVFRVSLWGLSFNHYVYSQCPRLIRKFILD